MSDADTDAGMTASEVDVETQARGMGWVPEDEWKGSQAPRAGFLSAEEFVKRGETVIPILRASNKEMERKLGTMEGQLKELTTTAQTLNEFNQRALERERREVERLKAELNGVKEQAVSDGDVGRYKAAEAQLKTLEEVPAPDRGPGLQEQAVINQWVAANPWFEDPEMQAWAQGKADQLLGKGYPKGPVLLEALAREAALHFPDRVAGRQGPRPGMVEGRGRANADNFGRQTFDDLPADAKSAFENFKRLGVKMTPSQYAKDYWAQQD